MALLTTVWGSTPRKITTVLSVIGVACGTVAAIPPAWSALELPVIATHLFVNHQIEPIRLAQADTTRAVWQLQLQNLQSSLYAAKIDQQKAPSPTVDQRIDALQQEIQRTQAKINAGQ